MEIDGSELHDGGKFITIYVLAEIMYFCGITTVSCDLKDNFVKHFANLVANAKPVHGTEAVLKAYNIDGDVRIQYNGQEDFERLASQFGIFEEWKVNSASLLLHLFTCRYNY